MYGCSGGKLPGDIKYHLIGYTPVIQPTSNHGRVHHMVVYACPKTMAINETAFLGWRGDCNRDASMPAEMARCKEVGQPIMGFGVGGGGVRFPAHVGLPFGLGEIAYVVLEIHYDKMQPEMFVDNSGIDFHYMASSGERQDAGAFWTGAVGFVVPPGQAAFGVDGVSASECSASVFPPQGVSIFGAFPHTHLLGRSVVGRHVRNGTELAPYAWNPHFDFNFQAFEWPADEIRVLPGDELHVRCEYDSRGRSSATMEGPSTQHEMCLVSVLYYPRAALTTAVQTTEYEVVLPEFAAALEAGDASLEVARVRRAMEAYRNKTSRASGDDSIEPLRNLRIAAFLSEAGVTWSALQVALWKEAMAATEASGRVTACFDGAVPQVWPLPSAHLPLVTTHYTRPQSCGQTPVTTPSMGDALQLDRHPGTSRSAVLGSVILALALCSVFTCAFVAGVFTSARPKSSIDEGAVELERRRSEFMERVASESVASSMGQTRNTLLDRVALVGSLPEPAPPVSELNAYFVNFFRAHTSSEDAKGSSGLLLTFESSVLVVVEHAPEVVAALLRELAAGVPSSTTDAEGETAPLLVGVRLLALVEDIPRRRFPLFAVRAVTLSRAERYDLDLDDAVGVASTTYVALLKLGDVLTTEYDKGSDALSRALDSLRSNEATSKLIPVTSSMNVLLSSSALCTLDEYMEIYEAPVDIALDSELQYPPPFDGWWFHLL
ncbi:uncharacterized protein AMSG_12408 [Thecamonas trahens ATCC 50062]|uniref:Copper type II ascorbate-dependent monooxygenase C-terminal domain-containing protein n=1 Tax=Thecamonas trahens ATCC 50062 TaxID=461836 RepID=A0A0L0DSV5_THETB|nr:hypothetical protein AMSG_12408 [Thecamonas trahens ATCC 50062]KNC55355.1 hypothetical protein AMSG_12408 [Thecamonas trahens ATCC 50062]|eukprot:XP_013753083.1 hypothetical protein AMSG_12408 [Thecamonas trahens ATCC 50062]